VAAPNATVIVPLLQVSSMEQSLAFYNEGFGFTLKNTWTPDAPDKIRWAWLTLGTAHLMLQEPRGLAKLTSDAIGNGVGLYIQGTDALAIYRDLLTRQIAPSHEPQVGNVNWEIFYTDPDGYKINLASRTGVPEETLLSQL
jgi:catechol 2,3-dioxygenase-like lactoylglutathione lyase family enzyme